MNEKRVARELVKLARELSAGPQKLRLQAMQFQIKGPRVYFQVYRGFRVEPGLPVSEVMDYMQNAAKGAEAERGAIIKTLESLTGFKVKYSRGSIISELVKNQVLIVAGAEVEHASEVVQFLEGRGFDETQ